MNLVLKLKLENQKHSQEMVAEKLGVSRQAQMGNNLRTFITDEAELFNIDTNKGKDEVRNCL